MNIIILMYSIKTLNRAILFSYMILYFVRNNFKSCLTRKIIIVEYIFIDIKYLYYKIKSRYSKSINETCININLVFYVY